VKNLVDAYRSSPSLSIKYDTYFPVYEELLSKYRGTDLVLVEVGVFNGGSLFMWREYLGPQARIIGIDLNPSAKIWEQHGFEIHIGDQACEDFWENFFEKVGPVDVFIDDGGHTNLQQIATVHCAIEHIRDGGVLIVEDVHTSYFREFGNPWGRSFVGFATKIIDAVNSRAAALATHRERYAKCVHQVSFFESIVALHVNTKLCKKSSPTSNGGITQNASDFRYQGAIQSWLFSAKNTLSVHKGVNSRQFSRLAIRGIDLLLLVLSRLEVVRHSHYWRSDIK
jgi:23S rRNA U2552 (ribose-2'-O)-methylase RlmE/FtsJ